MRRSGLIGLVVLLAASGARAEGDEVPQLHFYPGVGVAIFGLSLELNLEGPRWYGGGQLAIASTTRRFGLAAFAGVRGGAYLSGAPSAPFVGLGVGRLSLSSFEDGAPSSDGWGASAEVGMAFRRDRSWFRPQLVLQAIVPFAQHTSNSTPPEHPLVLFAGVRLLL